MQKISDDLKTSSEWLSGGDAYTTVMVDLNTLQLEVITQGPQPLRDVYLNIYDPKRIREMAARVNVPIVYPTVLQHLDYRLPVTDESTSFMIRIYQTNGSFTEYLNLAKQGNRWIVKGTELYRDKDKKQLIP